MDCSTARGQIGPYIDGELGTDAVPELEAHLCACADCTAELAHCRGLVEQLAAAAQTANLAPPAHVWSAIEQRLAGRPAEETYSLKSAPIPERGLRSRAWFQRPLAAAASLAFFLGSAVTIGIWLNRSTPVVQAAAVDYSVLLDGLGAGVDEAVHSFFRHYGGREISPGDAQRAAAGLDFSLPDELPGGFRRESVHRLSFGGTTGVAACYRRQDEPLVVFFHPPANAAQMGVHRESHCHVAGREGHRVEVGPWQLLHFTDPTTCHCLLSKLPTEAEQSAVFAAVAPRFERK